MLPEKEVYAALNLRPSCAGAKLAHKRTAANTHAAETQALPICKTISRTSFNAANCLYPNPEEVEREWSNEGEWNDGIME
jgi:hypothetical protein